MLIRSAFILLMNLLLIGALDVFYKNDQMLEKSSVSLLRRLSEEKNNLSTQQQARLRLSTNVNANEVELEDFVNMQSGETPTAGDRSKRAAKDNSKFIVGGKQTNIDAFPWMAYISINLREFRVSFCGGSLISSKYVVTAAHCLTFELQSLNDIHVTLGEYDIRTYPRDCVYFNGYQKCINNIKMFPEKVTLHQMYNRGTLKNDIALIRLRGTAPISDSIHPIPLPPFDIDDPRNTGISLSVAGWGSIYEGGPVPGVKRDTIVNLVPFGECRTRTWVADGKVCAIGQRRQDSCHGDSGGPLMAYHQGNYFLVGLVSGKELYAECGSKVPTTYLNVYKYLRWINRNMSK